ncbi:MAG: TonB family protein [Myxococcales bacterium]
MKRALLAAALLAPAIASAQESLTLPHEAPPEQRKAPELTAAPKLIHFVPAVYPPEAEKAGLSADVGLELDLGASGRVTAVRVIKTAGHGFDEAAVAAAKQFVFTPAEMDHQPTPVTIDYVYHFVLRKIAPAPPPKAEKQFVPVSGRVLERASKKPVGGATVRVTGVPGELLTHPDGSFEIQVPVGLATFDVFAAGDEPLARAIPVYGKKLALTFYLRPKIEGFHTVVTTTKEKDVVEEYTLQREEFRLAPGTFGDPLHVITDLPGVARSPFDLGFLVVRGADPYDTDFYLDGIQVPLIYHFGGGPAVINPEFLDKIDFYPGGQGAKYGHAIGGTVDVTSRKLEADRIHAIGDVNTDFASAFIDVPVGADTTIAAAGRRSYFDLLLKPFLGAGVVIIPYFWDYQLKVDHGKATDKNTFSAMAYGSQDVLQIAAGNNAIIPGGFSLDFHSTFHHLVVNWTYKNGRFKSALSIMGGWEDNNIGTGVAGVDNSIWVTALRHDMSYELTPKIHFDFGEDVSYGVTSYSVTIPTIPDYNVFPGSSVQQGSQNVSRVFHLFDAAPWVQSTLDLPRGIKVIPGVRFDYYHVPGSAREDVEPRLVLRWALTDKLTAKGSIGLYDESPLVEYFDAQYGTPGLLLQSAWQYSGGFEYRILPPLSISMVGFYSDRFNLVNGFLGPTLPGQSPFNNDQFGRAYGLEVFIHHDLTSRFFAWLSYTFSRSESIAGMNQQWGLDAYDETHILTVVASYRIGWGFTAGARFRLVSGLPMTPVGDATYDSDQDTYIPIYGPYQSSRLPLFKQLDLRIDKEFTFDTWRLGLYVDVWNVTDAQNEEGTIYDYRYRTFVIIPSYPILPMIGIRGEY